MIRLNLNARVIYYMWIAMNCLALIYSGYFQLMGLAFLKSDFRAFAEVHSKLYPFDTTDIHYFDITEALLYIFIPLFVYNYLRKWFPKRKFNCIQNPY